MWPELSWHWMCHRTLRESWNRAVLGIQSSERHFRRTYMQPVRSYNFVFLWIFLVLLMMMMKMTWQKRKDQGQWRSSLRCAAYVTSWGEMRMLYVQYQEDVRTKQKVLKQCYKLRFTHVKHTRSHKQIKGTVTNDRADQCNVDRQGLHTMTDRSAFLKSVYNEK